MCINHSTCNNRYNIKNDQGNERSIFANDVILYLYSPSSNFKPLQAKSIRIIRKRMSHTRTNVVPIKALSSTFINWVCLAFLIYGCRESKGISTLKCGLSSSSYNQVFFQTLESNPQQNHDQNYKSKIEHYKTNHWTNGEYYDVTQSSENNGKDGFFIVMMKFRMV